MADTGKPRTGAKANLKLRKEHFNKCDPDEPLDPDDPRCVDIDATSTDARGRSWIGALANRIELSDRPVCEFFSGLPGSGKSTELRRLTARLSGDEGANLFPVLIDAEEVLDIYNPIDVPDILVAILYRTEQAILEKETGTNEGALVEGRLARLWHWVTTTEAEFKSVTAGAGAKAVVPGVGDASADVKVVLDLKTNPSLRRRVRDKVQAHMTTFIKEVHAALEELDGRAKKQGYEGLVVIFDSLEKLRGISNNWTEVLTSAERVFTGGAPYLKLPVHVIYTLPPALVLRLQTKVHFLPMLKLHDKKGKRAAGFASAREIVRQRVPDKYLSEFLGPTTWKSRIERLIERSGGYPRDLVRLLQTCIAEPSLDEPLFHRLLALAADEYVRTIPENAVPWLARVHREKRIIVEDDGHRATVDQMLQNNVVLRYQNDEPWADVHPAVRDMPALQAEVARLEAAAAAADKG